MQNGYTNEQVLAEIEGILGIAGVRQVFTEEELLPLREAA
jgi:hypothetical protein